MSVKTIIYGLALATADRVISLFDENGEQRRDKFPTKPVSVGGRRSATQRHCAHTQQPLASLFPPLPPLCVSAARAPRRLTLPARSTL